MAEIITMGEAIVEIMRDGPGCPLGRPGVFKGPYPSGAPAIFIDTVARLGHSAAIISGVGEDDFGDMLVRRLAGDGVDVSMILRNGRVSTGCAFVTYFPDGGRKFIFHIGNTPAVEAPVPDAGRLDGCRFFHVMGCSVMAETGFGRRIAETARLAVSKGASVSFDPNVRPELMKDPGCGALIEEIMSVTNVFLPGKGELEMLSGIPGLEEGVAEMFRRYPVMDVIAVKDGSHGSAAFTRDSSCMFGTYEVRAVDATGAGDSFDAAFVCGLAEGKPLEECLKLASAAGALNAAAFGPMEGAISPENICGIMRNGKVI